MVYFYGLLMVALTILNYVMFNGMMDWHPAAEWTLAAVVAALELLFGTFIFVGELDFD